MCAGPAIGGLVLGFLGWHWVFWVSVPFGLAGAIFGWLILPQTATMDTHKRFDWNGALLLGPAIVMLVLALNQVTAWGATSPFILGLVAAAVVLIWLLIRKERNSSSPLVDLRLFSNGGFTRGIIAVVLGYALLYGMFFLMSFALEHGYGDTPQAAGLRLAAIPIALGLVAPLSGTLSDKLGEGLLSAAGMGLCLAALIILAFAEANPDTARPISTVAFIIFGAGLGVFIAPNNHATLKAAPGNLSGEAGSMLNLMRALGTSLGVAAASSTLSWRLENATGLHQTWIPFAGHRTLGAIESSLLVLALMAVAAAGLSLVKSKR
jgi:predicted MFS family arabinose efflux permease